MATITASDGSLPTHPPWELVPGIYNFRDLGGYPIKGTTGSVKRNIIYRSAEPSRVTGDGMALLVTTLKVKSTYDLRSNPELKSLEDTCPVVDIPGITRHFVPVFEQQDLSPDALAARYSSYISGDLTSVYRSILTAGSLLSYRSIFKHILDRPDEPLLIHCTAGKDRTGVICALLLSLAGVEDDVVAEEYALTEIGLEPFKQAIRERLGSQPQFVKGDEEARKGLENMLSSTAETMRKTLAIIRDEFGGVENYIEKNCGFTKEEVETIRENITSGEKPCFYLDGAGKLALVGQ